MAEASQHRRAAPHCPLGEWALRGNWPGAGLWGAVLLLLLGLPAPIRGQDATETVFWESVECESKLQVQAYLEVYPSGAYVSEARTCLEQQLGLDRAARVLVQQGLASLDYSVGAADGLFGPATRSVLREWQRGKGFVATGYLTREQADALIATGRDAVAAQQEREEVERLARAAAQAEAERRRKAEEEERQAAAEQQRQAQAAERQRQAEEERRRAEAERPREMRNSLGMEFVLIEPGTFEMGSPVGEDGRRGNETLHRVTISEPFYLGKYEVTRGEFGRFVAATGYETRDVCWIYESGKWEEQSGWNWRAPGYRQSERDPVVCVSWVDAQAYARWVSEETGEAYRLPTEAEWEYAARGGRASRGYRYAGSHGLSRVGWYWDNSDQRSHPVGQKQPNELGLYDMSGNVWEWVADWYSSYSRGPVTDPRGPSTGTHRVIRGGGWLNPARSCRAARRSNELPGSRSYVTGFRLARTP